MDQEAQKTEALRLFRIWMEKEKLCAKYILGEPLDNLNRIQDGWQNIVQDYENRKSAESEFREFVMEYPESW